MAKLLKAQDACQKYSRRKTKTMPWYVQALKEAMETHMGGGVVWLPSKAKIIEIPRKRLEGRYAKVRWI
jgi:hypothetical protein